MRDNAAVTQADLGYFENVEDTLRDSYAKLSQRAGLDDKNTFNALSALTYCLTLSDRADEGLVFAEDALARLEADVGPTAPGVARVLERVGNLRSALGDAPGAEQALRRAREIAIPGQDVSIDLALAALLVRDPQRREEAVALAKPWLGHWRAMHNSVAHYVLARAEFARGELDEAQRIAREALALPSASSGLWWAASGCRAAVAAVQLARGESGDARRTIDEALAQMARRMGASNAAVSDARATFAR
jgi:tetratricopeptide (TPR) repeat protein